MERSLLHERVESPPTFRQHEFAALTILILYPFLGFAIALLGHGMISPRCVVPVCCGFGIAFGVLAFRIFGPSPRAGCIILALALLWVTARESACAFLLAQQRTAFFALRDDIALESASHPIVVADSLLVLPLAHYSSPPVRARILFPIDFAAIHAYEADDSGEQNLWAGRNGVFPVHIVPYDTQLLPAQLIVVARPGGWLTNSLQQDGFHTAIASREQPSDQLGGVFTPMAHEDTRILRATR